MCLPLLHKWGQWRLFRKKACRAGEVDDANYGAPLTTYPVTEIHRARSCPNCGKRQDNIIDIKRSSG